MRVHELFILTRVFSCSSGAVGGIPPLPPHISFVVLATTDVVLCGSFLVYLTHTGKWQI